MKIILRQDVPELGSAGQTVEVHNGYGRNYLIPRNLAIPATKANLQAIGEIAKQQEIRQKKMRREAEVIKEKIESLELSTEVLVGDEEKLYGSITNNDIAALLAENGVSVDKRAIQLEEPIRALGVYTIGVKVDKDVTAHVKLWVVKKSQ